MKTENTLENKRKFFSLYYDQKIINWNDAIDGKLRSNILINDIDIKDSLELTPLSDITDEDAIECIMTRSSSHLNIKIYKKSDNGFYFTSNYYTSKRKRNHSLTLDLGEKFGQHHIDYLRSKGYAIPWMGLLVGDLVDYGWVKLKTEEVNK